MQVTLKLEEVLKDKRKRVWYVCTWDATLENGSHKLLLEFNNIDMAQVFVVKLDGFVLFCYIKRYTMLQP